MRLPDTLTLAQATEVLRSLSQQPSSGNGAAVEVDASSLRRFDSSALAVLLECARSAKAAGRPFVLRGAPAGLVRLAELYGIKGLLFAGAEPVAAASA